jgi:hypothetical protein
MPGRIYIELINYPMLFKLKASATEYKAGLTSLYRAAGSSSMKADLCAAADAGRGFARGGKIGTKGDIRY